MSYLRGPMTRDQISQLMTVQQATAPTTSHATGSGQPAAATNIAAGSPLADDETTVMPEVATGVAVRWVDPAAAWLAEVGGSSHSTRYEPAVVARVQLRYDDTKAALIHDEEYECVLYPLHELVDVSQAVAVDYDDRDLRAEPPAGVVYALGDMKLTTAAAFSSIERDLRDELTRARTVELPVNNELKLFGRPGETIEQFEVRCLRAADEAADADLAKLRGTYAAKVAKIRDQIAASQDRVDVLESEADGKRNSELLSTAGSILGGLLGGKSRGSILGKLGSAAGRRGRSDSARERVEAATNKTARLTEDLEELELELAGEVTSIDAMWMERGKQITTLQVGLEKADVKVTQLVVAWIPV